MSAAHALPPADDASRRTAVSGPSARPVGTPRDCGTPLPSGTVADAWRRRTGLGWRAPGHCEWCRRVGAYAGAPAAFLRLWRRGDVARGPAAGLRCVR